MRDRPVSKSRKFRATFLLLLLSLGSALPTYAIAQDIGAGSILGRDWWDPDWRFRRPLLITNNLDVPQQDVPIFVFVEVEGGSILNADQELRVVGGTDEIPSHIIHETVDDDGFVVGAHILFVVDLEPGERFEVNLYYGNPTAEIPEYRSLANPDLLEAQGQDSFSMSFDAGEQSFLISFGGLYENTFAFILSDAANSFGSTQFNGTRFDLVSEWNSFADLSENSLEAGRLKLRGASLLLVLTAVWNSENMWISLVVTNVGPSGTGLTAFTSVFDFSEFANLGHVEADYTLGSSSFQVGVAGSWFSLASDTVPRLFDILPSERAYVAAERGNFSRTSRATNDVAFISKTNMGLLSQKERVEQLFTLGVGGSREDAISSALSSREGTSTLALQLEVLDTPIPRASMVYRSSLSILNFSSEPGLSIGLDTDGSKILPAWSTLGGRISYQIPDQLSSSFEPGSDFWEEQEEQLTAIAYSSSSHLSAEKGRVGRLWASVAGAEGNANASLVSSPMLFKDITSVVMNFSYRASYLPNSNASGYLTVNIDNDLDLVADEIIAFPIRGLNYSLPYDVRSYLERLTSWDYVAVDLTEELLGGRSMVWVEISLNVYQGFVELNLDDFVFKVSGDAQGTMRILPIDSGFELEWIGEGRVESISGDIVIGFQVVTNREFSARPNAEFDVEFSIPELNIVESSSPFFLDTVPHRALIHVSRPSSIDEIRINGQLADTSESIRISGLIVLGQASLEGISHLLQVKYIVGILSVETRDVAGVETSDIVLQVSDSFGRIITSIKTNSDGKATILLAPAEYLLELFYHDVSLGSRSAVVRSDVTIRAEIPIYQIRFRVLDSLGLPVSDATISLLKDEIEVNRFLTSQSGIANFQMVGGTNYRILIDYLGQPIYDSEIRANIYGTTLVLQTDIVPFWLNYVIAAVLIIPVLVVVLYFRGRGP